MSDLISRNRAISILEQLDEHSLSGKMDISNAIYLLENQPTAYSVDKVVEELKELKMRYFLTIANTGDEKSDFAYENVGNVLDKAIEIVKQCGVADDACEWKIKDACYTSSIKHYDALPTSIVKTFTNCPYCGKKIKVVE